MALAEFDLEQESLAAIGAGVLADKSRRVVAQGEAALAGEQAAERGIGPEIDLLGDLPDIEDRRRAIQQNRRLVVIVEERIGDNAEIDAAIGVEFAEIAVETHAPRESDRVRRGMVMRHRLKKTGAVAASWRTGIGGEIGAPDRLCAPELGRRRVRCWHGGGRRWHAGGRCWLCSGQAGEILLDLAKECRYRRGGLGARRSLPAAGATTGEHEEGHNKADPPDERGVFPSSRPKASHVRHWEYPTNEHGRRFGRRI